MKWKDNWIHENLIPAYQSLVDQFWDEQKTFDKKAEDSEPNDEEVSLF